MGSYIDAMEGHVHLLKYWQTVAGEKVAQQITQARDGTVAGAALFLYGQLALAETYYVGPQICDLLDHVSETVPGNATLQRDELLSGSGFVWLENTLPVHAPSIRGNATSARSYSWCVHEKSGDEGLAFLVFEEEAGFGSYPGVVGSMFWPFEAAIDDMEIVNQGNELTSVEDSQTFLRWHYALQSFTRDRVLVHRGEAPTRAARRRLPPDWRPSPLIRVIQLRRSELRHETQESTPSEWSHRWLVGGHWRQQWYPSLRRHQPKWIAPYVKGPQDKPLKPPRARVFAVVR